MGRIGLPQFVQTNIVPNVQCGTSSLGGSECFVLLVTLLRLFRKYLHEIHKRLRSLLETTS